MSMYDDPARVAEVLEMAADAGESSGHQSQMVSTEILRAAARLLRAQSGRGGDHA